MLKHNFFQSYQILTYNCISILIGYLLDYYFFQSLDWEQPEVERLFKSSAAASEGINVLWVQMNLTELNICIGLKVKYLVTCWSPPSQPLKSVGKVFCTMLQQRTWLHAFDILKLWQIMSWQHAVSAVSHSCAWSYTWHSVCALILNVITRTTPSLQRCVTA